MLGYFGYSSLFIVFVRYYRRLGDSEYDYVARTVWRARETASWCSYFRIEAEWAKGKFELLRREVIKIFTESQVGEAAGR